MVTREDLEFPRAAAPATAVLARQAIAHATVT